MRKCLTPRTYRLPPCLPDSTDREDFRDRGVRRVITGNVVRARGLFDSPTRIPAELIRAPQAASSEHACSHVPNSREALCRKRRLNFKGKSWHGWSRQLVVGIAERQEAYVSSLFRLRRPDNEVVRTTQRSQSRQREGTGGSARVRLTHPTRLRCVVPQRRLAVAVAETIDFV